MRWATILIVLITSCASKNPAQEARACLLGKWITRDQAPYAEHDIVSYFAAGTYEGCFGCDGAHAMRAYGAFAVVDSASGLQLLTCNRGAECKQPDPTWDRRTLQSCAG